MNHFMSASYKILLTRFGPAWCADWSLLSPNSNYDAWTVIKTKFAPRGDDEH